ncbi:hypothetical protein F5Y14DRAFT_441420 [Nemania sp. NC0429]|nr:hypothetical protein F5Y14DRAFT_441420 [Nemania sp. NC0429]
MPGKESLGDGAVKASTEKTSGSQASKNNDHCDTRSDREKQGAPEEYEQLEGHRSSTPQLPSTTAVSSDESVPTDVSNTTSPIDGVDVEQTPAPSDDVSPRVTESQLLDLATRNFPAVSADAVFPPLPKPVLVPRVHPGAAAPFLRAWAPELADHAVAKEDFVAFIDYLNIINTPHLAFRVMEVTGAAVGLVPYDVAEGVGGALEGIAIIGTIALNYKRKKDYFALMNEKYFHPRKLHVKVIGTKRLKRLLGLDKKDPCLAPLTEETLELTSQDRCLRYLSQYTCELSFDVPAPSPATTTLAKITAWQIRHKVHKADRLAKAGRKRAWKRHQKGKNPQDRLNSLGERTRVKSLDWILVQNLEEWEAQRAEKERKKEEKRKASQQQRKRDTNS